MLRPTWYSSAATEGSGSADVEHWAPGPSAGRAGTDSKGWAWQRARWVSGLQAVGGLAVREHAPGGRCAWAWLRVLGWSRSAPDCQRLNSSAWRPV